MAKRPFRERNRKPRVDMCVNPVDASAVVELICLRIFGRDCVWCKSDASLVLLAFFFDQRSHDRVLLGYLPHSISIWYIDYPRNLWSKLVILVLGAFFACLFDSLSPPLHFLTRLLAFEWGLQLAKNFQKEEGAKNHPPVPHFRTARLGCQFHLLLSFSDARIEKMRLFSWCDLLAAERRISHLITQLSEWTACCDGRVERTCCFWRAFTARRKWCWISHFVSSTAAVCVPSF